PRSDRATRDTEIGRDLGIGHIRASLVQLDGGGFELIGVLVHWHGFYSHSPAQYGPVPACPPLRVHPRCHVRLRHLLADAYGGPCPRTGISLAPPGHRQSE